MARETGNAALRRSERFVVQELPLRGRRREDSPDCGLPDWTPLESQNECAYKIRNGTQNPGDLTQPAAGAGAGQNDEPERPRMSEHKREICKLVSDKIKMSIQAFEMHKKLTHKCHELNQANSTVAELEQRLGAMSLELADSKSANADLTQQLAKKSQELVKANRTAKELESRLKTRSETIRKVLRQLAPSRAGAGKIPVKDEDGEMSKRKLSGESTTTGEGQKRLKLAKPVVKLPPRSAYGEAPEYPAKSSRASHFTLKSWQVSHDTCPSRK